MKLQDGLFVVVCLGVVTLGLPIVGWTDSEASNTLSFDAGILPLEPPSANALLRARQETTVTVPADKYERRRTRNKPLLVIHETAMSGKLTLSEIPHPKYRASFHVLILRDGSVIYAVPPDKTAYGAGLSQFKGEYDFSDSGRRTVNHFAYQIELESPEDGYWCHEFDGYQPRMSPCLDNGGQRKTHQGYTLHQYAVLAELAVRTGIPKTRITTHAAVDLSGTRTDPRSFNWAYFWQLYDTIQDRDKTISLGIE